MNETITLIVDELKLKKQGGKLRGACPFCSGLGFVVHPIKAFFYCFNCNEGGSIASLVMRLTTKKMTSEVLS